MPKKRSLKIIESPRVVKARILFELREVISKAYKRAKPRIEIRSRILIRGHLYQSDTVQSLLNGQLRADFGLSGPDAHNAVSQILDVISRSINVDFVINKANLVGSIKLDLLPVNISQITGISAGSYINSGRKGGEISWLEWLLTKGTQIVVDGYHINYEDGLKHSRSGKAEMRKTGHFRINPSYAGTVDDNFITRSIGETSDEIFTIISSELERAG
jgi:hypothetical protein